MYLALLGVVVAIAAILLVTIWAASDILSRRIDDLNRRLNSRG